MTRYPWYTWPGRIIAALIDQFRDRRPRCPLCGQRMDAMNEHEHCSRYKDGNPVR